MRIWWMGSGIYNFLILMGINENTNINSHIIDFTSFSFNNLNLSSFPNSGLNIEIMLFTTLRCFEEAKPLTILISQYNKTYLVIQVGFSGNKRNFFYIVFYTRNTNV